MELSEVSMKDWFDIKKSRDRGIEEWSKGVQIKRCSCGNAYSYGYYPVENDPGACQNCRGAEGELVI
jgi:hypothetical protein